MVEGQETWVTCQHFWVIESPNGSDSRGICKFCGEERVFANSKERYEIKDSKNIAEINKRRKDA